MVEMTGKLVRLLCECENWTLSIQYQAEIIYLALFITEANLH